MSDLMDKRTWHRNPERKFLASIEWQGDCLVWTAGKNKRGYGAIWDGKRMAMAHRFAWEREHGPIPEGMVIDHVCHTPACVRLEHLRVATPAQNQWNRRPTAARSGHKNVYPDRGKHCVSIMRNGVRYGGRHDTLEAAVSQAEALRTELDGDFAYDNERVSA